MAFGGLAASRGDPVSGDTRAPNVHQWSGTRTRSFFGNVMGKVLHADQYARAACDSISRIVVMLSALASSAPKLETALAVDVSRSLRRATCSCPAIFLLMSSRAIR